MSCERLRSQVVQPSSARCDNLWAKGCHAMCGHRKNVGGRLHLQDWCFLDQAHSLMLKLLPGFARPFRREKMYINIIFLDLEDYLT